MLEKISRRAFSLLLIFEGTFRVGILRGIQGTHKATFLAPNVVTKNLLQPTWTIELENASLSSVITATAERSRASRIRTIQALLQWKSHPSL